MNIEIIGVNIIFSSKKIRKMIFCLAGFGFQSLFHSGEASKLHFLSFRKIKNSINDFDDFFQDFSFLTVEKLEHYFLILTAIEENVAEYQGIRDDLDQVGSEKDEFSVNFRPI